MITSFIKIIVTYEIMVVLAEQAAVLTVWQQYQHIQGIPAETL